MQKQDYSEFAYNAEVCNENFLLQKICEIIFVGPILTVSLLFVWNSYHQTQISPRSKGRGKKAQHCLWQGNAFPYAAYSDVSNNICVTDYQTLTPFWALMFAKYSRCFCHPHSGTCKLNSLYPFCSCNRLLSIEVINFVTCKIEILSKLLRKLHTITGDANEFLKPKLENGWSRGSVLSSQTAVIG